MDVQTITNIASVKTFNTFTMLESKGMLLSCHQLEPPEVMSNTEQRKLTNFETSNMKQRHL